MNGSRAIYVISDLHIGGTYGVEGDRGFRMCTRVKELAEFVDHIVAEQRPVGVGLELVINGDFIDFLAESDPAPGAGPGSSERVWKPAIHSPSEAVRKLDAIVRRDAPFFKALAGLVDKGHALTVLLGNHDVELSYPAVDRALRAYLGVTEHSAFTFILDDQAYPVGDALIEHGNRYDGFNRIDHDALRRTRAMQSRGEPTEDGPFQAPPGSRLVAYVMNPIKAHFPFVDLLKPETEAVLPILAALVPSVRWKLPYLVWLQVEASLRRDIAASEGEDAGGARGTDTAAPLEDDDGNTARPRRRKKKRTARQREEEQLLSLLSGPMTEAGAAEFLRKLAEGDAAEPRDEEAAAEDAPGGRDIAGVSGHVVRLLGSIDPRGLKARLPALLDALRAARNNQSFDLGVETEMAYLTAAQKIANTGRRYVVFGHTHLAKQVALEPKESGATYFNTGTWADLIPFPDTIFDGTETEALASLWSFVDDLENGRLKAHIKCKPSYVKLDLKDNRVERAILDFWPLKD